MTSCCIRDGMHPISFSSLEKAAVSPADLGSAETGGSHKSRLHFSPSPYAPSLQWQESTYLTSDRRLQGKQL